MPRTWPDGVTSSARMTETSPPPDPQSSTRAPGPMPAARNSRSRRRTQQVTLACEPLAFLVGASPGVFVPHLRIVPRQALRLDGISIGSAHPFGGTAGVHNFGSNTNDLREPVYHVG
jgi:hypothetical protein